MNARTRAVASIEEAQRALDHALTELEAVPSLDPALVGFVAHALNSYVNAVSATTEMLQEALRDSPDADVRMWLEGIRHATDLMQHTIGRLLHSSAPADFPLKPTYVNLTVMIERACRYYRRLAHSNVTIVSQSADNVPPVWADRVALAMVVDNLFSNALKVSPQGSTVHIEIVVDQGDVICSVTDAGPFLTRDEQEQLLQQMVSGAAEHPDDRSKGFDLAVAWEFVDRMGGTLWLDSEPGRGTRFSFRLPARP